MFVLPGPREKFSETEINHMKKYLEGGGSILVMLGEGGEKRFGTNINFLLEEYGIMVNNGMCPVNMPALGLFWADAASIGPVPAQCWHRIACLRVKCVVVLALENISKIYITRYSVRPSGLSVSKYA